MTRRDAARRIAALYTSRWIGGYAYWKIRIDPVYAAVAAHLRGRGEPVVDVGCGVGILPFYLREHGFEAPIAGFDFDERKIAAARAAAKRYRAIDFVVADARAPLPSGHHVVVLDVLQYVDRASRHRILTAAARVAPPGGVVIVRAGIRDRSWRYRTTAAVDRLAHVIRWMKTDRIEFSTRDEIVAPFAGFDMEVTPLWGRTPFNNYLFVFTKRAQPLRA